MIPPFSFACSQLSNRDEHRSGAPPSHRGASRAMGTAYRQRETKLAAPIAFSGCQLCETRRSLPRLLTRLQFETSFNSVAAAPSALSKVHTVQFARSAEASKCTSIHPRPRPASFRSATKFKTSSCSAIFTDGKALNRPKSSSRLRSVPQANSPITNRWQQTPPLSSSVASRLLPFLRWSIHTDVSTSVIMLRVAGDGGSGGVSSQCRPMLQDDVRSPAQSTPPTLAEPVPSFRLYRSAAPPSQANCHRCLMSFSYASCCIIHAYQVNGSACRANGSAISCAEASGLSVMQLLQPVQSSVGLSKQIE